MKKILLGLALTSTVALASANAADMYVPGPAGPGGYKDAPYVVSWAGFYAGVNGGYGWNAQPQLFDTAVIGARGLNPSGGFGGGQIGYNWQGVLDPRLVLGIEADIQGASIGDNHSLGTGFLFSAWNSRLDYFGTVRGRLGYALGPSLLYATGGFAYGGLHNENDGFVFIKNVGMTRVDYKNTGTPTGYVAGGGYEYKFNPAWSLKVEYQYINLGRNDITEVVVAPHVVDPCIIHTICKDDAFHTVRAGLNYHFGTGYVPLK